MAPVRSTTLPDGGFALPLVIMITTIIMFLSTAFLTLADTEQTIAQNQVAETQALYIADAGVEKALALLEQKPVDKTITVWYSVYQDDLRNMAVGEGTANVTVQEQGGLIEITSEGKKGNATKVIIAKVLPPSSTAYEYGLAGGDGIDTLKFTGNGEIETDIAYKGNILINSNNCTVTAHKVVVTGDLTVKNGTLKAEHESADPPVDILHVGGDVSAGDIQGKWQYDVGGGSVEAIDGVAAELGEPYVPSPPQIDWTWYQENADWSAAYPDDDDVVAKLEMEPSEPEILYFSGNLTMRSQRGNNPIEFRGIKVLVVSGNVTIQDDIRPAGTDDALMIVVAGTITVSGNKTVNALMISEDGITMKGSAGLEGSFWSSTIITTKGTVDISYDEDMVKLIRATGLVKEYSYRLVSWQEEYPVF